MFLSHMNNENYVIKWSILRIIKSLIKSQPVLGYSLFSVLNDIFTRTARTLMQRC